MVCERALAGGDSSVRMHHSIQEEEDPELVDAQRTGKDARGDILGVLQQGGDDKDNRHLGVQRALFEVDTGSVAQKRDSVWLVQQ